MHRRSGLDPLWNATLAPRHGRYRLLSRYIFLLALLVIAGSVSCWADYSVVVTSTPEKIVDNGALVTHVFSITNTGSDPDIYILDLEVPEDWSALPIPATLSLPAGDQGFVFVNFLVSPTAAAGPYDIVLNLESSFDPGLEAEETARVVVRSSVGLELEWVRPLPQGQPGGSIDGSFRVTSTGNAPDLFRINAFADEALTVELSENEFELSPGETRIVSIRVSIPITIMEQRQFTLTVSVSSIIHTSLQDTLRAAITLGPPPPELVGGTLYPEWFVTGTFSIDCGGEPTFAFRGWGDIEGLGKINASVGLSMDEGFQNARAQIETENWTLNLSGGGIGSSLLSVSGKPFWSGKIEDWFSWHLLYTEAAKGLFAQFHNELSSCRISFGHDPDRNLSFQEVEVRADFPGPPSAWFTLESGTQTDSGTAMGLGGKLEFGDCAWDLEGSYLSIEPGFPLHSPLEELELRASFEECPLPFDFSATWVEREAGTAPNEYLVNGQNYAGSFRLPSGSPVAISASFAVGLQESDDTPQTTDTISRSVSAAFSGSSPVSWSLSGSFQTLEDRIAATTVSALRLAARAGLPLGPIRIDPSFSIEELTDSLGSTYSSGLSLRVSAEDFLLSPEITLSVGGDDGSLSGQLSWEGPYGEEFSWTASVSLCDEPTFSTKISLTLLQAFPFCGPTKGRITGYAFADVNGNGIKDASEEGVTNVLFEVGDQQAISGSEGWFVFPPMLPGTYTLDIVNLPPGLTPGIELPLSVEMWASKEDVLWIPLEPRSWLRGRVFLDANQNAYRDGGDQGLSGIRVHLQGQGVDQVVTTDSSGRFIVEARPGPLSAIIDVDSLPERAELTTSISAIVTMPIYGTTDVLFGVYQRPRPIVVTFGPPNAMFSAIPSAPRAGEAVTLIDESVASSRATIVDQQWQLSLGDTVITRTGPTIAVALPTAGAWRVRLIVTDSDGLKGAVERVLQVR